MEGDTVIFDCLLDSEVDIEWTLDDEKLEESEFIKFQTKKDGTELLVLEDVTIDYAGHYGITATNSNGSISCMAELVIHGMYMTRCSNLRCFFSLKKAGNLQS